MKRHRHRLCRARSSVFYGVFFGAISVRFSAAVAGGLLAVPQWLRNAVLAAFNLLFFAWALKGRGHPGAAGRYQLAGRAFAGAAGPQKRPLLILLILLDLAVLGGFKYAGFAAETVNALIPGLLPVLSPALPLGLSFTCSRPSALCRCGRWQGGIGKEPIRFAVFLAFFGHGPSGPIVRYRQQARSWTPAARRRVSADRFCYGIKRLVLGLAKRPSSPTSSLLIYAKVASVPAATLPAPILALGYRPTDAADFDFSGYSDSHRHR